LKDLKLVNLPKDQSNITEEQRDCTSSSGWNPRIWPKYRLIITMIKILLPSFKGKK